MDYTKGLDEEKFLASTEKQDAVIRRLEIIGEAASHLDKEFRAKHPEVPWREVIAMRNLLIHEYFSVNLELVWETIQKSLPELEAYLSPLSY